MSDKVSKVRPLIGPKVHWIDIAVGMLPAILIAFVVTVGPALPILWFLFLPCLPPLVNGLITFFFTDIELNQHRLVCASGLLRRQTFDLPLARIESVLMEQSLLGRLMDYGQVTIIAIGSSPIRTPSIRQPAKFREALQLAVSQDIG
jgi:uncharacterized membrane protein YdbT with pleckstrin-like domain